MKAFLSNPDEGITSLRPDLYETDLRFLMRESLHEAQRILEETEPMRPGYVAADRRYYGPINHVIGPIPEARYALAESLASFINTEVQ